MSVREYIGARYIPVFSDPIEWDNTNAYEPLTVVTYQGASYVSKQSVPPQIEIDNETYWIKWADYNAQLQAYIDRVETFDDRITANSEVIQQFNEELATEIEDRKTTDSAIEEEYKAADSAIEEGYKAADSAIEEGYKAADSAIKDGLKDSLKLLSMNANNSFAITNRFMLGSEINNTAPFYGRTINQGNCIVEKNGIKYWIVATSYHNSQNDVVVFNQNNEYVGHSFFNLGHANGASWNEEDLVVFSNTENNTLVFLNVSNPASLTLEKTVKPIMPSGFSNVHLSCFVGASDKIMLFNGQLEGYNFNLTEAVIYTNSNCHTIEKFINLKYNSNEFKGLQSAYCDGTYIYICHSAPEAIIVFDMEGNVVQQINLPKNIEHIQYDEAEGAFIYKNELYISCFETLKMTMEYNGTDYATGVRYHLASLFKTNLDTNAIQLSTRANNEDNYFTTEIFNLYDPIISFNQSPKTFYNRLLNPSRYGFMFYDDIFTIAENRLNVWQNNVALQTDYNQTVGFSALNAILNFNNHNHAGLFFAHGTMEIVGTGKINTPLKRSDTNQWNLVCANSRVTISSNITFSNVTGANVQINDTIYITNKALSEFSRLFVNSGTCIANGVIATKTSPNGINA